MHNRILRLPDPLLDVRKAVEASDRLRALLTSTVNPDPLLDVREGAAILQISVPTWWRHVKNGTIPKPIKIGSLSRWPLSEILGVIEQAKARRATA